MASEGKHPTNVRLMAFDVDGVFTDGRFYLSNDGVEAKAFHTQDGYGIRKLLKSGVQVAVISGRQSAAVDQRMQELGIEFVVQGCKDKVAALDQIIDKLHIEPIDCGFVGDDIPDLPLLRHVGFSVAVANAVPEVISQCDHVTHAQGGNGAVREICELVIAAAGNEAS